MSNLNRRKTFVATAADVSASSQTIQRSLAAQPGEKIHLAPIGAGGRGRWVSTNRI